MMTCRTIFSFFTVIMVAFMGVLMAATGNQPDETDELVEAFGFRNNEDWEPLVEEFDGVEVVLVPRGCFIMGSDIHDVDERPAHWQCFENSFWIDRYEVTNQQFAIDGEAFYQGNWKEPNRPRERLKWLEASAFCRERGGRLPTEAEWEYAARGPSELLYPWGNEFVADYLVYGDNSGNQTAEVGSKPDGVSWVGAYDMLGNVWEWTSSIFMPYPYVNDTLRENGIDSISGRTIRGGSWATPEKLITATYRFVSEADNADSLVGFRCMLPYEVD